MADEKTERQLLQEISAKMDKVIGSVAIIGREKNEQIKILRSLGFEWNDIGILVGLEADAARKRLNSLAKGTTDGKGQLPFPPARASPLCANIGDCRRATIPPTAQPGPGLDSSSEAGKSAPQGLRRGLRAIADAELGQQAAGHGV